MSITREQLATAGGLLAAAGAYLDARGAMTEARRSSKRRRPPGLEDALAKGAQREDPDPLPWCVRDMRTGDTMEFSGRGGYHLAQARQVAGLYFDPARPLAVVAADGSLARHQGDKGLVALVKPSRERPGEPGLSEESFRCVCVCVW